MKSNHPIVRRSRAVVIGAIAALAFLASPALAGTLYVAHGITGSDLGLPNNLPVDIGLDGACTPLLDVEFGQSALAGTFDAGIYEAQVYLANGAPCSGTLAVAADVAIPVVGTVIVIAHLDQNGVPTLSSFSANVDDITTGLARVQVVHTAAAPAVDVMLKGKGSKAKVNDLGPGEQSFAAELVNTPYKVQIKPSAGGKPVLKLDGVSFTGDAYTSVFAVGSLTGGTFTLLPVQIP